MDLAVRRVKVCGSVHSLPPSPDRGPAAPARSAAPQRAFHEPRA